MARESTSIGMNSVPVDWNGFWLACSGYTPVVIGAEWDNGARQNFVGSPLIKGNQSIVFTIQPSSSNTGVVLDCHIPQEVPQFLGLNDPKDFLREKDLVQLPRSSTILSWANAIPVMMKSAQSSEGPTLWKQSLVSPQDLIVTGRLPPPPYLEIMVISWQKSAMGYPLVMPFGGKVKLWIGDPLDLPPYTSLYVKQLRDDNTSTKIIAAEVIPDDRVILLTSASERTFVTKIVFHRQELIVRPMLDYSEIAIAIEHHSQAPKTKQGLVKGVALVKPGYETATLRMLGY